MAQTLLTLLMLSLSALAAAADVPVCTYAELGSLTTNPNRTACAKETGVQLAELTGTPTDAQLATVCESDACIALVNAILEINPDDCTLPTNEDLQLMSEFVDPVVAYCSAQGVSFITPNSSSDSSSDVAVGDDDSASDSAAGSVGSTGSNAAASSRAVLVATGAIATALTALALYL